jgi:hypothetical protein
LYIEALLAIFKEPSSRSWDDFESKENILHRRLHLQQNLMKGDLSEPSNTLGDSLSKSKDISADSDGTESSLQRGQTGNMKNTEIKLHNQRERVLSKRHREVLQTITMLALIHQQQSQLQE